MPVGRTTPRRQPRRRFEATPRQRLHSAECVADHVRVVGDEQADQLVRVVGGQRCRIVGSAVVEFRGALGRCRSRGRPPGAIKQRVVVAHTQPYSGSVDQTRVTGCIGRARSETWIQKV